MNILIIEDEPLGAETLQQYVQEINPDITVAGITESISDSVAWLRNNPAPDIILMDIELADGQSFEIFNQVKITSAVIFTTSYDEYALKAFTVNSIDYLLKPIKKNDLKKSLDKYRDLKQLFNEKNNGLSIESLLNDLRLQQTKAHRNRFLVKQGQRLVSVEVDDIAYFNAEGRLTFFCTWNKNKYVVDYTMEELETMLDPQHFFRANRGYIIHIKSVVQIHNYFNGKLKLELKPTVEKDDVLISREKAGAFKEWMGK
jgi:two-component system, LytTR family, response regulator LytT